MSNFKSVHENNSILSDYNGRVNIVQPPSMEEQFKMMEKIQLDNKCVSYRGALDGIQENNLLSKLFFSAENMQIVQNGIKAGVYKKSNGKYILPNQNVDSLKIIMRSRYLEYASYDPQKITEEIERLNKLIVDYCVPLLYSESVSYEKYCEDQSTLVVPLALPKQNDRDYKHLELSRFT
jgi:hypothetical protein